MRGEKVCGSELNEVIYGKPVSQVYFRAGAVSAILLASALSYTVAYVITAQPLFVWYTPTYLFVAVCALTLLLTFVYMAVISALGKRCFSKRRFAIARISSGDATESGFDFDVAVSREGKMQGYTKMQTFLVWVGVLSLIVSVAALGVITGMKEESVIGFSKLILSSIADHSNIANKVFCFSALVSVCAFFALFMARAFVEEGMNKVSVVIFSPHDAKLEACRGDKRGASSGVHSAARFNRAGLLEVLLDMAGAEKVRGGHSSDEEAGLSTFLDQVVDSKKENSIVLKHVVLSCAGDVRDKTL